MSPALILSFIGGYFVLLFVISWYTSQQADNNTFFIGDRQSKWYLVAFGMIGASLSGVTFISIPGWVGTSQFSYMQVVLGYLVGYFVIATILMPMYYRLNLTSIYTYLEQRFGFWSYKTGASFFLLSRTIGASFRLFLVAIVLQSFVFEKFTLWGDFRWPFAATVSLTILFIWIYTHKGGIKTIVWTDTLQTLFMLIAVGLSICLIGQELNLSIGGLISAVADSEYSRIFFFDDPTSSKYFYKQFFSGVFIAIVMTGLDQDMMQKNLSCRNIKEAQLNMFSFSGVLVFVNLFFLALGALLYIYANAKGIVIPERTDELYGLIALDSGLNPVVGSFFILGLIAAAYSSADSALTALTTSFCVDILDIQKKEEKERIAIRRKVHIGASILLAVVIILFKELNDSSVVSAVFTAAGYTYGPLLGLYSFGLFTKFKIRDKWAILVCVASPILTYIINLNSVKWLWGYKFGFEVLILNGFLTFMGLLAISNGKQEART